MSREGCDSSGVTGFGAMRPWGGLIASAAAVASTYLAASIPHVRGTQVFALTLGTGLSLLAGLSRVCRGADRFGGKTMVVGFLSLLTAMSGVGVCSLLALDQPRQSELGRFVDRLGSLGFYCYAEASVAERGRTSTAFENVVFDEATNRVFPCDPVDFARSGASSFLIRITPFLSRQRVRIHRLNSTFELNGANILRIDGSEHHLPSMEASGTEFLAARCAEYMAEIVNGLLKESRSPERIRFFEWGRVWYAVFLTDDLDAVVRGAIAKGWCEE